MTHEIAVSHSPDLFHHISQAKVWLIASNSGEKTAALSALAVSIFLFLLGVWLVRYGLGFVDYPALANEPRNLDLPKYTTQEIRKFDLERLQGAIDSAVKINATRSRALDRVRLLASLTPLVAGAAWVVFR